MRSAIWVAASAGVLLAGAHLLPLPRDGHLAGMPALCPFKALSGWPCPGCGLTRSIVFCAHGDWPQSLLFHPLGPLFYLGLWLALIFGVLVARGAPRPISQPLALALGSTYVAGLLIVWLIRLSGAMPYPPNF